MRWILGLTGLIFMSFLARDGWGWLPRLSRAIIWLETAALPAERRRIRRAEWGAELAAEYDDRRLTGLIWVLKLCAVSLWERATTPVSAPRVAARRLGHSREWVQVSLSAPRLQRVVPIVLALFSGGWLVGQGQWLLVLLGPPLVFAVLALFVGLMFILSGFLVRMDRRADPGRRRRYLELAPRHFYVLDALDELAFESQAVRIIELRMLRNGTQHELFDFPLRQSSPPIAFAADLLGRSTELKALKALTGNRR